jgi:hypothetical protein
MKLLSATGCIQSASSAAGNGSVKHYIAIRLHVAYHSAKTFRDSDLLRDGPRFAILSLQ